MKKILLVVPLSSGDSDRKCAGGVDAVAQTLVKHLSERKDATFHYRVLAFDPYSEGPSRADVKRVSEYLEIVRVPLNKWIFGCKLPGIVTQALAVRKQVSEYAPHIVHAHVNSWLLGASRKSKRIATIHSYKWLARKSISFWNDLLYTKIMPKMAIGVTDIYTCVGDDLRKQMALDNLRPIELIHNPIREIYFSSNLRNQRSSTNELRLVTCAIITRRKRIDKAIAIIRELVRRGVDANLTVIGSVSDHDCYADLSNLVCEANLDGRVKFLGLLGAAEIIEEYQKADLGIFCSEEETFGLAPMEMLAAGLPLITTSVGIFKERRAYFEGMGVRFLTDDCSIDIDAIYSLSHSSNNKIAQEELLEEFSVETIVGQYERLYVKNLS